MILSAAGVMEACVTRMPVWNLCWLTCWAKARICFMPMLASEENSIQMVPIWGSGLGSAFVGMAVYFASMASVGLKEVFIFLRLGGVLVWHFSFTEMLYEIRAGDRLRCTAGVSVIDSKIFKRYFDFFLSYFIALGGNVSGVSLKYGRGCLIPCPGTFDVRFAMPAIIG